MKKTWAYWVVGGALAAAVGISNVSTTKNEEVEEPIKYETKLLYDSNIREGVREVKQTGKNGLKKVLYSVTYKNGSETERKKQSEEMIEKPIDEEIVVGTKKYYKCSNGVEYESLEDKNSCEAQIEAAKQKTIVPTLTPVPTNNGRTGAICNDGTRSNATGRGACSHHGGVARWLY